MAVVSRDGAACVVRGGLAALLMEHGPWSEVPQRVERIAPGGGAIRSR